MFLEYDDRIEFKMSKHFRLMKLKKKKNRKHILVNMDLVELKLIEKLELCL